MPDASAFDPRTLTPEMSGKFTALINKIKALDDRDTRVDKTMYKHFIFTDIRESTYGAKALASFLIAAGYDLRMKLKPKTMKRGGKLVQTKSGETVYVEKPPVPGGCNGFAILQSMPLWNNPLSVATKKTILKAFNSRPDNVHGENLRIVVLDSKYKEGIDLFDVKYVHLLEPAIAAADLKQAVGRATRFCGQKGLAFAPRRGWTLDVYVYTTDLPGRPPFVASESAQKVDAHELMLAKSGLDLALLNIIKELTILCISTAVDYDLNYKINNFAAESALLDYSPAPAGGRRAAFTISDPSTYTDSIMAKCAGRKSKLFPFYKSQFSEAAQQLGLKVGKSAKRKAYCKLLKTHPEYLERVKQIPPPVRAPPPKSVDVQASLTPPPPSPLRSPDDDEAYEEALLRVRDLFPSPRTRTRLPSVGPLADLPYDEFQAAIAQLYEKYKWASPVVSNACASPEQALAVGKPVTFTQTQDFIRHYLTPASPFKGLLAWHSVGTGKTCMAIAAASSTFEKEGYTILWVTRNALMADMYKNMFGAVCSIPLIEQGAQIPDDPVAQKRMLSRAWLAPISYRTFQNALQKKNELGRMLYAKHPSDPLYKTFLIVDEIHKLQDGDLTASESANFSTIQSYIHASYKKSGQESVRPLLMTATPITDTPQALFEILNTLIADPAERLMAFDAFREKFCSATGEIGTEGRTYFQDRAKGLVSYLNREFDPTTFAQPVFHSVRAPIGDVRVPTPSELAQACVGTAKSPEKCYMQEKKRFTVRQKTSQMHAVARCIDPKAKPTPFTDKKAFLAAVKMDQSSNANSIAVVATTRGEKRV